MYIGIAIPLLSSVGVWPMFFICLGVLLIWLGTWAFYFRKNYTTCKCSYCESKLGGIGTEDDPSKASDAPLLGSLGGEGEETDIL